MIQVLVFIVLMAIIYFVVPIAFPVHVTLLQAAAITFLAILARIVLTENITVKIDGLIFEREDE